MLIESLGSQPEADAERFEAVLAAVLEDGLVIDAVIAKSQAERDRMWAMRDDVAQLSATGADLHLRREPADPRHAGYVAERAARA